MTPVSVGGQVRVPYSNCCEGRFFVATIQNGELKMKIRKVIIVGLFAFGGGMLRYLVNSSWGVVGILGCNLIGSFLMALLTYTVIERKLVAAWLSLGLGTGLIGALTTFSTFAATTIQLWQSHPLAAGLYFIVSSCGGLAMALLGAWLGRRLGRD